MLKSGGYREEGDKGDNKIGGETEKINYTELALKLSLLYILNIKSTACFQLRAC